MKLTLMMPGVSRMALLEALREGPLPVGDLGEKPSAWRRRSGVGAGARRNGGCPQAAPAISPDRCRSRYPSSRVRICSRVVT
jgi:hypothetical protein